MRKTLIVLCAAVALVVAACGGGDEVVEEILERQLEDALEDEGGGNVDINLGDGDDFEISFEGDDGESVTIGGGEVPESMDIDIPNGGDVLNTFESGDDVSVTLTWPSSQFDSLVSFYQDWVDGQGGEWNKTTSSSQSDDGTIRTTTWWNYEDGSTNITVFDCYSMSGDGLDSVCVTLVRSSQ